MIMENMDVDLSLVKKERMELDDEYGNILDNFTTENEYDDFPNTTSISCTENEDVNVDWLTSFFDEPSHDSMSGLNPPLSDVSDSGTTLSRMTSINCTSDILLDSYSTFSDDYEVALPTVRTDSNEKINKMAGGKISPTVCSSNNPFLSQTRSNNIVLGSLKDHQNVKIKVEEHVSGGNSSQNSDTIKESLQKSLASSLLLSQQQQQQQQNNILEGKPQQKLLLFMNTPENRAKLAGTNFNIINANLLSKISGAQSLQDTSSTTTITSNNNNNFLNHSKQAMNLINLKKCIRFNNTLQRKEDSLVKSDEAVTTSTVNATLQSIIAANQQKEKKILPIDILNGHTYGITRKERDIQEIDSGYESPASSSGSSPCSPPIELSDRKDVCLDTIQYIDIPPHERQPFYLSEEEKRTLIMEGLPVPQGLPLNKSEERALKKVRRKIKNKISAQESRRKKKEYMESLEKKVDCYASDNSILKKKVGSLEVANRSLIMQVQKLQALVATKITPSNQSSHLEAKQEIIDVEQ